MALIKCEECGYWFSSDDGSCPNCGCPIGEPDHPKPSKKGGKRALYITLAIALIVGVASVIAFMYNDMAKREQEAKEQPEMLKLELLERQKTDSIATVRAQEEALRKAREDSIEAAIAFEEQQRIEDEESTTRASIDKHIRINCTIGDNKILDYSSNAKCYIYDTWTSTISTYIYRAPQGKVWLYKGYQLSESMKEMWHKQTILEYFSRENEGWRDRGGQHYHYDKKIDLKHGDVPVIRSGDGIAVKQRFDERCPGDHWLEVYFVEKDEDDYY